MEFMLCDPDGCVVREAAVLKSNAFQWQKNPEDKVWWKKPSDKLVFYKINDPATVYNVNVYYRKENENKKEIRAFIDSCNAYWNANYSE